MKVLVDINILLDVILAREPWVHDALGFARCVSEGKVHAFIAATTLPTLFYVVRKAAWKVAAGQAVDLVLSSFDICAVDRPILESARLLKGSDFEDNIQIACAQTLNAELIATRDAKGYAASPIPGRGPSDIVESLRGKSS